jgi:hypothetical protein
MNARLTELKLTSDAATRAYYNAMTEAREALTREKDAVDREILFYENIEGCLTESEEKAYDELLSRSISIFNDLSSMYY